MDGWTDRQWMEGKDRRTDINQILWKPWAGPHIRLLSSLESLLLSITRVQDLIQKHIFSPFLKSLCFCLGTSMNPEASSLAKKKKKKNGAKSIIHCNCKWTPLSILHFFKSNTWRKMTGRAIY